MSVVENQTTEPQLEQPATQALIQEIQREGTLRYGEADRADVVLYVVLRDFIMEPLRYERGTATGANEYRMTLRAEIRLLDDRAGKPLIQRSVKGETDFVLTGDLSSAKRDAIPNAMADLAHQVVKAIVEFW